MSGATRLPTLALPLLAVLAAGVARGAAAEPPLPRRESRTGTAGRPAAAPAAPLPRRQESPRAAAPEAKRVRPQPALRAAPRAPEARQASDRVAEATHAAALFAQHSWYVVPPAPPPEPPPPPPAPTAPPFPYTFVGSYAPGGDPPVFFLAEGDRMIDARVGDRLDGVYQFESAAEGQLVFVYLPLNVRQNLAARVTH